MQDAPYRLIPLRGRGGIVRGYAKVDPEDFERFAHLKWHLSTGGYACHSTGGRKTRYNVRLHRVIIGLERGDPRDTDHINRDKLDCRRSNLRVVTRAENAQNTGAYSNNTSGYRGVSFVPHLGKWFAYANANGKRTPLGYHATAEAAGEAAASFRRQHTTSID